VFDCREGLVFVFFASASRPALGPAQPPTQWVSGDLSLGDKADHSSPSSAKGKKVSQYIFMAWYLVKYGDNLYLYVFSIIFPFLQVFEQKL
jgi:hypothetical protein